MKRLVVYLLLLFPFYCFSQEGNEPNVQENQSDTLVNEQVQEVVSEIDVESLNDSINFYKNKLYSLQKQYDELENANKKLKIELSKKAGELNAIDSIVYKQCLIRPLFRRYDPDEIKELIHCLEAMNIQNTHTDDYKYYYPLLEDYEAYNSELISFLERQKKSYINKTKEAEEIFDWGYFRDEAQKKLKLLTYYPFYKGRNSDPWQSITYLDEVIEDFEKQLQSHKLNPESLQELIDRLTPKKRNNETPSPASN